MTGNDSRNENRAAVSRSKPIARAAVIVTPDRDTPGCNATACATPSHQPSRMPRSSSSRRLAARRSTMYRRMPNTANMTATSHGWPRSSSITLSSAAPTMTPGIVPTTRAHASRWSTSRIARARMERTAATRYRTTSRRKYTSAPNNVPMCRATAKVLLSWAFSRIGQSNNHGTRMRCPELEIGANSESPCAMPSTIACKMVSRELPASPRRPQPSGGLLAACRTSHGGRHRRCHRYGQIRERAGVRELLGDFRADEQDEGRSDVSGARDCASLRFQDRQDLEAARDGVAVRSRSPERGDHVDVIALADDAGRQPRRDGERAQTVGNERGDGAALDAEPRPSYRFALGHVRYQRDAGDRRDVADATRRREVGGHPSNAERVLAEHCASRERSGGHDDGDEVARNGRQLREPRRVPVDEDVRRGAGDHREDGEELRTPRPAPQEHHGV